MKKILFVCTGNTCRSPMAQEFFNDIVQKSHDLENSFSAISAGIAAFEGAPASTNAIKVLQEEWDIDLSKHGATLINRDIISDAYLVLTMSSEHKDYLLYKYPEFENKIFTLKEFVYDNIINKNKFEYDYNLNISDPFGKSIDEYKKCAVEIKEAVEKLISILKTSSFS
ncbi:MAG TPA: low molecular weight protein arginine phosphatase [Clostridiaceae bacterium]|nr:low molecular weight protein arginine phosphatase [Clostridiaceae bacterium]